MLAKALCGLRGHRVDRKRVWNDGLHFRTTCARCACPLINCNHAWRPFDTEKDADVRRKPHPRYDV
ncbi:hypothetical protein AAG593_04465 [Citromicrobium bathyomarinum]|mgnify:FL=1|uniref:hypothetical protein n=1 Tax=Citromicrobium sp. WPS32 TaxID=1634517 RepID=UPI0006C8FE09|nr:hypothetical protein [Citromicrobium sp. WPS32]KPM18144.1 hypothetical protein WG75_02635 [Citromicrobium sp. WPS32]MAY78948.1 hypothetical protein [Citromicrobium sp.]|tara:strand:- start:2588 stop:2785 length:198 start_codon:yes stop_codon:yes gene_type:complete